MKLFLTIISFLLLTILQTNIANALSISLDRVVFNENIKTQKVTVINNQDSKQSYIIEWLHYVMNAQKGFLENTNKNKKIKNIQWADNMIKIEPREISIPAFSSKEITLSLIAQNKKISGEYRSHLWVRSKSKNKKPLKKGGVEITTYSGVSKPIFVRYGNLNVKSEIKNLKIKLKDKANRKYQAKFILSRRGNRSIYGSIQIACKIKNKRNILKRIGGIAVYTEVNSKKLKLNFKIPEKMKNSCNDIELSYIALDKDKYFKDKVISRKSVKFY